jgi:hypothetical protein
MILPAYHERPANCCNAVASSRSGGSRCSVPSTTSKKQALAFSQSVADRWPEDALPLRRRHDVLAVTHFHVHTAGLHVDLHRRQATLQQGTSPLESTHARTEDRTRLGYGEQRYWSMTSCVWMTFCSCRGFNRSPVHPLDFIPACTCAMLA